MENKKDRWLIFGSLITLLSILCVLGFPGGLYATDNDNIAESTSGVDVIHYDETTTDGLLDSENDLFYWPSFAGSSLIDTNTQSQILMHIESNNNPSGLGGLEIKVHPIAASQIYTQIYTSTDYRRISPNQEDNAYAIHLKEDAESPLRDTMGQKQDLGNVPTHGTPKTVNFGDVFTKRIQDLLDEECDTAEPCRDQDGITGLDLFNNFVLHVYTHETGHMLGPLATDSSNNHTDERKNPTVMDQAVAYKYSKKNKYTTFTIINGFRPEDQNAATVIP